ncbi:MAG: agmatine deiminase [Oscillospiraceae bacterium]|nr:agmatine deiminase [Oscillospiraceae bacterium]
MSTLKERGFTMPAEFSPHAATVMIFPERPGSWPYNAAPAMPSFLAAWRAIAQDERLFLIVSQRSRRRAETLTQDIPGITLLTLEQDDAWARDTCPTFVRRPDGTVIGISWQFNAWGGDYDGLYTDYAQDNALAAAFCKAAGYPCEEVQDFVLEGGSIHSDGEGTLLTTESCLLSPGRNQHMTRAQIERTLCGYLGAEKVLWLPRGIYQDETNEHVDNVCAFIRPAEVVLAWTDNRDDPQYALSLSCLQMLERAGDARGRRITVHKLPIPDHPVCITPHDLAGFHFAEGEDTREAGERLAASYVNFYFTGRSVLLPQFGGENAPSDARALHIMQTLCPDRRIVPIPARELLVGGGNLHCLTQQIPK